MTAPRSASSSATVVSKSSSYPSTSALSVASLLSSCRSLLGLQQIHAHIVRKGLEQHPVLATRFLSLCAAFSAPAYASSSFFDRIASPNLITWNALLGAHARCSPLPTIVSLFNLLRQRSPVPPDEFTFPSLLSSCSRSEEINVGSSVHATILRCGLETDVFVGTALVDFYRQCREVGAARKLFDSLLLRNEASWTVMIAGYLSSGDQTSARSLFDEIPKRNVVTWNSMIDGYVKSGDLVSARELFDEMPQKDAISYTSLIDGYPKAGDLASTKFLFEQSPDKDLFSCSAMISGFAQNGRPGDALKIFLEMHNLNIHWITNHIFIAGVGREIDYASEVGDNLLPVSGKVAYMERVSNMITFSYPIEFHRRRDISG